jgi:hypothetical protein
MPHVHQIILKAAHLRRILAAYFRYSHRTAEH